MKGGKKVQRIGVFTPFSVSIRLRDVLGHNSTSKLLDSFFRV